MKSTAVGRRVDCEVLTDHAKILEKCDLLNPDGLKGALWVPGDGVADPAEICLALAHLATEMGVTVVENCEVKKLFSVWKKAQGV